MDSSNYQMTEIEEFNTDEYFDEESDFLLEHEWEDTPIKCNACFGTGLDRYEDVDCIECWGDGYV
jgi:hypothetical protein